MQVRSCGKKKLQNMNKTATLTSRPKGLPSKKACTSIHGGTQWYNRDRG